MIPLKGFNEKLLQQAAFELAMAFNDCFPPNECQHKYFGKFEEKVRSRINVIGTKSHSVAIRDSVICK